MADQWGNESAYPLRASASAEKMDDGHEMPDLIRDRGVRREALVVPDIYFFDSALMPLIMSILA